MGNTCNESYILLDMQEILQIGGNVSSTDGIILFDNLNETTFRPISQMPLISKPMKLQYYAILVCKEGWVDFRLDCERLMKIRHGNIMFFQQGQIVEFCGADNDTKVVMIAFSKEVMINLSRFIPQTDPHLELMPFSPNEEFQKEIATHYSLMKNAANNIDITPNLSILSAYLFIILMNMKTASEQLHRSMNKVDSSANRQLEIYHRFVTLVKENFKRHRDVEFYASSLFLSAGHLSRIIKSISGKSVGAWIKDYVILEAKVILQSSGLTVSQVSDCLNFPNPSYFSKYFRENTGMTPGQYRKVFSLN